MPSTRSTVAANSKATNRTDTEPATYTDHATSPKMSQKDQQHEKRDAPQKALIQQLFDILLKSDKLKILDIASQDTCSTAVIETKLRNDEYTDVDDFKHDLDRLFESVLFKLGPDRAQHETLQRLYQFASTSLRFENNRLGRKPEKTNDEDELIDNSLHRKTALFRPTPDGFVFSDASYHKATSEKLPANIAEVTIHPTTAEAYEIPPLKQTVAPAARFPNKVFKHEDKHVVPIQWLDYGAFSSFAPACDSNNANVSYESTYMGRAAKRFRRWEKKQRSLQSLSKSPVPKMVESDNTPGSSKADAGDAVDTAWLESQGFDTDAIIEAAQKELYQVDELLDQKDIDNVLERNKQLFEQLLQCQEHRFSLSEQRWGKIEQKEQDIAETLQKRIHDLVSTLPPKSLVPSDEIPVAMSQLPLLETAYRGSLPPNKIFAFPTTDKADPMPPYANITPTYAKERWRLVDVAPIPRVPMEK